MRFWWCSTRRRNLLQGQGSHASSGVMMISKIGTSSPYHHPHVVEEDTQEASSKLHNMTILKVGEP
jgi:hypothetical protein